MRPFLKTLTQRKTIAIQAALAALLVFVQPALPPVRAQAVVDIARAIPAQPVYNVMAADDLGIVGFVKYVGASSNATVAVAANGDITFQVDGAAATSFECPISGGLGGIVDVSDTACDTWGEVADTINGGCVGCSSADWRFVLVDALRSDSSNDTAVTFSATQATLRRGVILRVDTDVAFNTPVALVPRAYRQSIEPWLGSRIQDATVFVPNPFTGTQTRVNHVTGVSTYVSGTSTWEIFSVKVNNATRGSEVADTILSIPAGATTVRNTLDATNALAFGALCNVDEKCLVRLKNSAAQSAINVSVHGQLYTVAR